MNKIFSISTARAAMTLLATLFCTLTAWAQDYTFNNVNYYLNSDKTAAYVGSSTNATGDITILAQVTINGTVYNVTSIGSWAFQGTGLTSVTIPASVESIGERAFYTCTSLSTVNFADNSNLTSIGAYAFAYTDLTSVTIPASVTSIGANAFSCCASLSTVNFADNGNLTSIGAYAFAHTGLTSVTIPASVESIGASAFLNCRKLSTVNFADNSNLTSIGAYAFRSTNLTSVTIPASVQSIGGLAFYACASLSTVDFADNSKLTSIGESAFEGTGLTSVTIPASVESIGFYAFNQCRNLSTVNFADDSNLTSIGARAFQGTGLTSVTIPASVESIGERAFYTCTSLSTVDFADNSNLTSIGERAFYGTGLTSITIPASVTSIGASAFASTGLTRITITRASSTALTLGADAFLECGVSTASLNYTGEVPDYNVVAFLITENCGYSINVTGALTSKLMFTHESNATSKATLQAIRSDAFTVKFHANHENATGTMDDQTFYRYIPQALAANAFTLSGYAFSGWNTQADGTGDSYTGSETVCFDSGVNGTVDLYAQWSNVDYTDEDNLNYIIIESKAYVASSPNASGDITIPTQVTLQGTTYPVAGILEGAFAGRTNLTSINIYRPNNSEFSLRKNAFSNLSSCSIFLNYQDVLAQGSLVKYEITDDCGYSISDKYASTPTLNFTNADNATSEATITVQTVQGYTSNHIHYLTSESAAYVTESPNASGDITIPNQITDMGITYIVTGIGDRAFYGNENVTGITIPEDVEYIGERALYGCKNVSSITIPAYIENIGEGAFAKCTGLTSITILRANNTELTLGDDAFRLCGTSSATLTYTGEVADGDNMIFAVTTDCGYEISNDFTTSSTITFTNEDYSTYEATIKAQQSYTYTVKFHANLENATGTMDDQTFYQGISQALSANAFSLGEWRFSGWNTQADGSGDSYSNSENVSFDCEANGSVDLYAQWAYVDYTIDNVNYSINGGEAYVTSSPDATGYITIPSEITVDGSTYPVTSIGASAFYSCKGLTSITIPASVTSIGEGAFRSTNLTSIIIPASVESIGARAFQGTGLTSVTIPASVESIGEWAFYKCKSLSTVNFADNSNLTSIGTSAFEGTGLTSITIPASVQSIGASAFNGCISLSTVNFADNSKLTSIGASAFKCPKGRLTSITIPASVESIGESAFDKCAKLSTVNFADNSNLTSIGEGAFRSTNLTSITIPASVESIGGLAFFSCKNLTSITIYRADETQLNLAANALKTIASASVTLDYQGELEEGYCMDYKVTEGRGYKLLQSNAKYATLKVSDETQAAIIQATGPDKILNFSVSGSEAYVDVSPHAFGKITIPSEVTIDETNYPVTSIGAEAFKDCSKMTSVVIPESVTSIGEKAFFNCDSLPGITISASVTTVGTRAFSSCSKLADVTIIRSDNTALSLGENAFFDGLTNYATVNYTGEVAEGSSMGFAITEGCGYSVINTVSSSSKLYFINDYRATSPATLSTQLLSTYKIHYDANNSDATGKMAVQTVLYDAAQTLSKNGYALGGYKFGGWNTLADGTGTSYADEASVTNLASEPNTTVTLYAQWDIPYSNNNVNYFINGSEAYVGRSPNATGAITILSKITVDGTKYPVTSIGENAFYENEKLTSISISKGVKSIGKSAIYGCDLLESVTIPSSVTSIGETAFAYSDELATISIPYSVTTIESDAFYGCTGITDVYCYADPSNLTWTDGVCDDFQAKKATQCHVPIYYLSTYKSKWSTGNSSTDINITFVDDLTISVEYTDANSVKYITSYNEAYVTSSPNATGDITIPSEITVNNIKYPVTSIGASAFDNCAGLTSIAIPASVESIGASAFDATGLTSITIPASVESIGERAFYNCASLSTVDFADNSNLTSIGASAFNSCRSLTSITIPASVESIGFYAFYQCGNLSTVNFADNSSLTSIGESAFNKCTNLTSITIPASVESIGERAFNACGSLSTVNFADNSNLTSIGAKAFYSCRSLTSITIPASVESIGERAFGGCDLTDGAFIHRSDEKEITLGKNAFPMEVTLQYTGSDLKENECAAFEITDNCNYLITDLNLDEKTATLKIVNSMNDCPQAVLKATKCTAVTYNDDSENTVGANSNNCVVTLSGRTLYRDGNWNTLCLPFDVNLNASNGPLYGATAMALSNSSFENGTLTLTFTEVTADSEGQKILSAGIPYLIKWATTSDDITDPVFPIVTISSTTPGKSETTYVDFVGCYSPVTLAANDTKSLFLSGSNTLYYPSEAVTVNSFRGYFKLKNGLTAGPTASQIRAINLNFDEQGESNSISTILPDTSAASSWYTLDGRRLLDEPNQPGMYIRNGQKVMIK